MKTLDNIFFHDYLSLAVHFWFDHTEPILGVSAVTDQQHESVSTSDLIDLVHMGCGTEVRHEVKETMTNIATKRDAFTTPKNDDLKYIEKLKIQVYNYIFSLRKCVYTASQISTKGLAGGILAMEDFTHISSQFEELQKQHLIIQQYAEEMFEEMQSYKVKKVKKVKK